MGWAVAGVDAQAWMNGHTRDRQRDMMLDRINAVRAALGLPLLRGNAMLDDAARGQVADLARNQWLIDSGRYHEGADGSDIGMRLKRAGYTARRWLEVVGWGFGGDAAKILSWWMNSPVHRATLLSGEVTEAGVAYLYASGSWWGHYWCVDFGRPSEHADGMESVTEAVDLLPYLRGDGRSYRVGNARGSFELFQSQAEGDRFYQVKAWDDLSVVNWEGLRVDDEFIRRDVDTSPGGGRFYRQFDAPWVRRFMRPEESYTQPKRVQFYWLYDCDESSANSGIVLDTIRFVARHTKYTFPANGWNPVTLGDVIELEWLQGGEVYYFARGFGLVGWGRRHDDPESPSWSAICEMRPEVGRLDRLRIGCMEGGDVRGLLTEI